MPKTKFCNIISLKKWGNSMSNNKLKLTKSLFTLALLTALPSSAYADETINVKCEYSGNLITMINPTYWDYDYNIISISTPNTNIRLTKEEFNDLINNSSNEVIINDEGSTVIYNKEDLLKQFNNAENIYNENSEIIKKIVLNGGVTIIIVISTSLCIYGENKTKKLK